MLHGCCIHALFIVSVCEFYDYIMEHFEVMIFVVTVSVQLYSYDSDDSSHHHSDCDTDSQT